MLLYETKLRKKKKKQIQVEKTCSLVCFDLEFVVATISVEYFLVKNKIHNKKCTVS